MADATGGDGALRFSLSGTTLTVADPAERCRATLDLARDARGAAGGRGEWTPALERAGAGAADAEAEAEADAEADAPGAALLASSYPVEDVVTVRAGALTVRGGAVVVARDPAGGAVRDQVTADSTDRFAAPVVAEVCTSPKLYLHVGGEGVVAVRGRGDATTVAVEGGGRGGADADPGGAASGPGGGTGATPRQIAVGARSRHARPRRTLTVTADPRDLMDAVSATAAALKTTSPERSWATLRGRPPRIEVGDQLDLAGATPPATSLEVAVPPTPGHVLAVAPLAFYLPARVVPGDRAVVRTPDGPVWDLSGGALDDAPAPGVPGDQSSPAATDPSPPAVGRAAGHLLRHAFTLDCAVRGAGLYDYPLRLRRDLLDNSAVDIDPAAAYDLAPAPRLERYAAVPTDPVAATAPDWPLRARLAPRVESATLLPHLLHELATVVPAAPAAGGDRDGADARRGAASAPDASTPPDAPGGDAAAGGDGGSDDGGGEGDAAAAVESFLRRRSAGGGDTRAAAAPGDGPAGPRALHEVRGVLPPTVGGGGEGGDAGGVAGASGLGRRFGEGVALRAAAESRFDAPAPDGPLEVTVVCNDAEMAAEVADADDIYGDWISPTVRRGLPRAALAGALAGDADLLHFVGHADERGLHCPDGPLDVAAVDAVGPRAVVFNACRSAAQGRAAVRGGAVAAVVTLADVVNTGAVAVGRRVARLLDAGFPVRGALAAATGATATSTRYAVVGDGSVTLGDDDNRFPCVCEVAPAGGGDGPPVAYDVRLRAYPADDSRLGSVFHPRVPGLDDYFLSCGATPPVTVPAPALDAFLSFDGIPVRAGGEFRWSDAVDVADVAALVADD